MSISAKWLNKVKWNEIGLVPVIAQELGSNDVLMFAWMNRDALSRTLELGEAVYWSRSRKKLWHKGEESGHYQKVHEIRLDCDEDVVLLKVEQVGGIACHTGRHSCFFQKLEGNADSAEWNIVETVTAAEQLPADSVATAENSAAPAAAPAAAAPATDAADAVATSAAVAATASAPAATSAPAETTEARPAAKRVRKTPTKTPT